MDKKQSQPRTRFGKSGNQFSGKKRASTQGIDLSSERSEARADRSRFGKSENRLSDKKRGEYNKAERFSKGQEKRFSGTAQAKPAREAKERKAAPAVFFADKEQAGTGERIAKRLARVGIASRREAESMIVAGRIGVNGKVIMHPAVNVTGEDVITVDGKKLPPQERTRLWLYHKPAGLVTTNRDEKDRPTVFEKLPEGMPRVISVGRLDINTEGLLLLTNDGGLARLLELPATGWLRRYRVRAHGRIRSSDLDVLKEGIAINGIFYGRIEASIEREQGSNVWLSIGLREGKNREVKNILGSLGLDVARLIRVSYGPFQLGDLAVGEVREIRGRMLQDQLGERLIESANVDFDAPILNPMTRTRPSRDEASSLEKPVERNKDNYKAKREWISSTPPRQRQFKGVGASFDDDQQKKKTHNKSNNTNVWMAPGARPQGKKNRPFEQDRSSKSAERFSDKRQGGKKELEQGGGLRNATDSHRSDFRQERRPNLKSGNSHIKSGTRKPRRDG